MRSVGGKSDVDTSDDDDGWQCAMLMIFSKSDAQLIDGRVRIQGGQTRERRGWPIEWPR